MDALAIVGYLHAGPLASFPVSVMKILIFLISFIFPLSAFSAASTVVYPFSNAIKKSNIGGVQVDTISNGAGRHVNLYSDPIAGLALEVGGIPGLASALPYAASAIGDALILKAPVSQFLAKKALIGAVTGGVVGLGATYLFSLGLEYAFGQWTIPNSQTWNDGIIQTNQYGEKPSAGEFCSTYFPGSIPKLSSPGGGYCANASGNIVSYNSYWNYKNGSTPPPQRTPITNAQAEAIAAASPINPTDNDIQMMLDAGWGVPISNAPLVKIDLANLNSTQLADLAAMGYFQPTPESLAIKNGQPVLDPVTGQNNQPMLQIDPAPNAGVRLTPYNSPVDAAGNPQLDAQGNPLPNTKPEVDPCELNPDRAGCSTLGELKDPPIQPRNLDVTGNFNSFNISGQCPADKTFTVAGMTQTIQMAPICGAATDYIRPFLLLSASIVAYMIFVGGLKS